jgi:flagellar basal-body rod modification protein FlgD
LSIADITALSQQQKAQQTTQQTSRTALSQNFDTFLTLLTSQLKNQDPLSPVDSNEFTQQLVQYSQVEQQIQTNDMLTKLSDQQKATASTAALSYLGRTATIASNATTLSDGQASWTYTLGAAASSTTLSVVDASGREVFRTSGTSKAGENAFVWDGMRTGGSPAADGTYRLVVNAVDGAGKTIDPKVQVSEKITGVDFSGADPSVMTRTGARAMSDVMFVKE